MNVRRVLDRITDEWSGAGFELQELESDFGRIFASVTYNRKEVQDDPRVTGGKCIVCPSCGRLMRVNFVNTRLC